MRDSLRQQWFDLRERLMGQVDSHSSVSLRLPGGQSMWLGKLDDLAPQVVDCNDSAADDGQTHAAIYRARADVGAVLLGGGAFAKSLVDFGGVLPILFDEQARHIGHMATPASSEQPLARLLKRGQCCGDRQHPGGDGHYRGADGPQCRVVREMRQGLHAGQGMRHAPYATALVGGAGGQRKADERREAGGTVFCRRPDSARNPRLLKLPKRRMPCKRHPL